MYLILKQTGPEPYSTAQLIADNPGTSFPASMPDSLLADWQVFPYQQDIQPAYDPLVQTCVPGAFRIEEGSWRRGWEVDQKPLDAAEAAVRDRRDALLSASDWVVIKAMETGAPVPQDWAAYRAALRDIPQQAGFPYNVIWPTKPE